MPEHSFNTEIAKKYGILEAVLLKHIYYWVKKNEANKLHYHNGRYWTYNTAKAFQELFDYVSLDKIKRALKHLKDENLIETGTYNEDIRDRTLWYTLTDSALCIVQERSMERASTHYAKSTSAPALPDINLTDINTDNDDIPKGISSKAKTPKAGFVPPTLEEVQAYCKERNSSVDPKQFFEYFNAGNWVDSKGQRVRNWKQKLMTWEKYNTSTNKPKVGANGIVLSEEHDDTLDGIL